MNSIFIKGRLVRDPELKTTTNGIAVTRITVAVDRPYQQQGEKLTDFFDCVFWRQGAEFVNKWFVKGQEIIVTGEMQSRKWQDKEGNNRINWEIGNAHAEFCGKRESGNAPAPTAEPPQIDELPDDDSDLPF